MFLNQMSIIQVSVPGDVQNRYVSEQVHHHIRTLDEHSSAKDKFYRIIIIEHQSKLQNEACISIKYAADGTIPYFLKAHQVNVDNLNWLVPE